MKTRFIPGLRIIKTVMSVLLCLILFSIFDYPRPIYALLACVLMMKSTPEDSMAAGKERMLGTLVGGIIAEVFLSIMHYFQLTTQTHWMIILLPFAIFCALMVCKIFRFPSYAASMSCVLILIVMMSYTETLSDSLLYVGVRMIETAVGIVISVVVNIGLKVPKQWVESIEKRMK